MLTTKYIEMFYYTVNYTNFAVSVHFVCCGFTIISTVLQKYFCHKPNSGLCCRHGGHVTSKHSAALILSTKSILVGHVQTIVQERAVM